MDDENKQARFADIGGYASFDDFVDAHATNTPNHDSSGDDAGECVVMLAGWPQLEPYMVTVFNKCIAGYECTNFLRCCSQLDWWNIPTVIFDVGANIGGYTQFVSDCLKQPNHRFHLFEANYFHMTTPLHARYGNDPRIKINMKAVADYVGSLELGILGFTNSQDMVDEGITYMEKPRSMAGITTACSPPSDDLRPRYKFNSPCTTIDVYCAENNIAGIHWLKLDIEGYELNALQGAKSMLSRGLVVAGQFEIGPDVKPTIEFLKKLGYNVYHEFPIGLGNLYSGSIDSNFNHLDKVVNDLVFMREDVASHIENALKKDSHETAKEKK